MAQAREQDLRPWYLLSPALAAIALLVVVPMSFILVYSFYENIDLGLDRPAFQFGNWHELLTDSYYHVAIWKTLRLSVIVTVLAALMGYVPAYFIAFTRFHHKWLLLLLLIIPFWISFIIRTLSWIHIMGNEGVINALLLWLGVIDQPLHMMYNEFAVVVGFIHVFLPYMILNVYVSLEGIDRNLEPAARTLGCTPWQAFLEVTLPLSLPGLAAGCLLVFVLTAGSYVTPLILGGPDDFLFGNLIYDAVMSELNWPMGATLSFTLLVLLGLVVVVYSRFMRLNQLTKAFG
ncbi:spermidine/putrescine transport system permease protein [Tistlia consotensis]|uniref:Spermidine/putrescine transport system permease protein n=1 Tax=Tistlia consotensis USBA 355 TaxID=560819 RepID=A0A1Y6C545_9PROT|nr:ABC transporter permease [Tistlia consotensis]SMF46255.1 spermidine/putrescine transport system permease protein [Tistlia consotensis USBA 355]SNR78700.1 spermidine/putrescine transport system permease protein [Tistlia consotensis]